MTTKSHLIHQVRNAISIPKFQNNKQAQLTIAFKLLPHSLKKQLCLSYVEHFMSQLMAFSSARSIFQHDIQIAQQYLNEQISLETLLDTWDIMEASRLAGDYQTSEAKLCFSWIQSAYLFCFWNELSAAKRTFAFWKPNPSWFGYMSYNLSLALGKYSVGSEWDAANPMIRQVARTTGRIISASESDWQLQALFELIEHYDG